MASQEREIVRLEEIRAHTLADIARLRDEMRKEIEPSPATDADAAADVAADIYERSRIMSVIQRLEEKLDAVGRAIHMATKGTYGVCEKCGETIPQERLEIVPETTFCVRCASELERRIGGSRTMSRLRDRRPRLPDDLLGEEE